MDKISACNNSGNFKGFCEHFALPMTFHADQLDMMLTKEEELRSIFDTTTKMIKRYDADSIARGAVGAELVDPDILSGHHMTCLQRDGQDVFEQVTGHWIMRRQDDRWRVVTVVNGLSNDSFPLSEWFPSDGVLPGLNIKKRTET